MALTPEDRRDLQEATEIISNLLEKAKALEAENAALRKQVDEMAEAVELAGWCMVQPVRNAVDEIEGGQITSSYLPKELVGQRVKVVVIPILSRYDSGER
jgi:predicted nuclease with TOPRIM domain